MELKKADVGEREHLHCHIIVNGSAGFTQLKILRNVFTNGIPQLRAVIHEPKSVVAFQKLIEDIPLHEDLVIAGGDGTLHCAVTSLMKRQQPFALLPLGTANDFSRHWGHQANVVSLYQTLRHRIVREVDVIQCNDAHILTVGGLGVGSFLTRDFNTIRSYIPRMKKMSQLFGTNVYTGLAAATILGRRSYLRRYEIETPYERFGGSFSNIFVCNQPGLGGNLLVAPQASASDGVFDVLFLRGQSPVELLSALAKLRFKAEPGLSHRVQCREMTVRACDGRDNLLFADGESVMMGQKLNFTIRPKALKIFKGGDSFG